MSKRKNPNPNANPNQQPSLPDEPQAPPDAPTPPPALSAAIAGASSPQHTQHILFGSVEDLLADMQDQGVPEGNIVRVERLVRTRQHTMGGVATQGVLITARRNDEVLSAWVIVGRLALDPWGQPLDHERARASAERHRDAQRMIGAQVADAGFAVRTGFYLLPDAGYGVAATTELLDARSALSATTASHVPMEIREMEQHEEAPSTILPDEDEQTTSAPQEGEDEHA